MRIYLIHDISLLIKLLFNTPKFTKGLDALLNTYIKICAANEWEGAEKQTIYMIKITHQRGK
jgi:hypothetical protein